MIPRAFVGSAADGGIYALAQGYQDGATGVDILAETRPIAPGGPDADTGFNRVYVTLTWSAPVVLRCTPIVDRVALTAAKFDITLGALPSDPERSQVFERALAIPYLRGGVTRYRKALRGTWFSLRIESVAGVGAGTVIIDRVELDYDVLDPTKVFAP